MRRAILLALLTLCFAGCEDEPPPEPAPVRSVRYVRVGDGAASARTSYSGVSRSSEQARLSFRVSGRVRAVHVSLGDQIKKGELLAELDSGDFDLQVAEAGSAVAQARAQAQQTQAEYQRIRALYEAQSASRSELDVARVKAKTAASARAAAASRAALARNQARYTRLSAPTDGRVSVVSIQAGENVAAGQPVVILESGTRQEITVGVPENVIARLEQGSVVDVTFPALDKSRVQGTISEVGVAAEGATYPITIRLLEEPAKLRAGMAADVSLSLGGAAQKGLLVPGTAVAADAEGSFVYVAAPTTAGFGKVERRAVELGPLVGTGILVRKGLKPGELVVTAGVTRIHDGLQVRLPSLAAETETAPEPEAGQSKDMADPAPEPDSAERELPR